MHEQGCSWGGAVGGYPLSWTKTKGVHYRIRTTPSCHFHHFKNCVRQFSKTSWWKTSFIGLDFSTLTTIGCNSADNAAALSRCLKMWKILCACRLPYPKAIKNNLSSLPIYSVFFLIRPQKRGCCELVFGLLRPWMASMSSKDRAQITFRSEILHNGFEIELGRW